MPDLSHSRRLRARECVHLGTGRLLKEELLDRWTGQRDAMTPPLRHLFDGTTSYAEFRQLGTELLRLLVAHGLQPTDDVLEVGSGNGKNARALTTYLRDGGQYDGFDVVAEGVNWCQRRITPRYPHFRFQQADVYNRTYHPGGSQPARRYRFPYPDAAFDLVFLTSVFTHMLPDDLGNYVGEIARVLRPGGHCFASLFLLNEPTLHALAARQTSREFPHVFRTGCCRVADRDWPEDAVAYDEGYVRNLLGCNGLAVAEPIAYGSWREDQANGQELVWTEKKR